MSRLLRIAQLGVRRDDQAGQARLKDVYLPGAEHRQIGN